MMVVVILFRLSTVDVNARFDGNDCVDDGCIDRFVELVLPAAGAIEFLFGATAITILFDGIANGLIGMVSLTARSTMFFRSPTYQVVFSNIWQHPSFDISVFQCLLRGGYDIRPSSV